MIPTKLIEQKRGEQDETVDHAEIEALRQQADELEQNQEKQADAREVEALREWADDIESRKADQQALSAYAEESDLMDVFDAADIESLVDSTPFVREQVDQATVEAFMDARQQGDVEARLDIIFHLITGIDPDENATAEKNSDKPKGRLSRTRKWISDLRSS